MAKKLQILRGTTAQNDAYTGSIGELTMDTEKVEVRIHDGTTQGGKTIGSGGGASLPILTHVFSDHKLNDISWLNADTFSWQSGDVYVAAYEHLVDDIAVSDDGYITTENGVVFNRDSSKDKDGLIAWTSTDSITVYTSNAPAIGEVPSSWDDTRQVWGVYGSTISSGSNVAQQETVGGVTITFYRAEDGHKICLADQESNVQAIYEATGVAWYYILDTVNKQFKLPRTKFGFTGLRDSVGKYVEAGLPNITGSLNNTAWLGDTKISGAFRTAGKGDSGLTSSSGTSGGPWHVVFEANRSSSIYGNSTTVQPKATQMYLYFYVGNFERDAIEQTAGITSEQLNNKLDKSSETYLVPSGAVSAFAGTTAPTGWLKCDGSAISRTTYSALFDVIGTTYGAGDGSTTFNLPNLTGRVPLGMDASYVGKSTNGVLPNITGECGAGGRGIITTASGCFQVTAKKGTVSTNTPNERGNIIFNASLSNSMYGNGWFDGERVVPSSVGMTYCIKY